MEFKASARHSGKLPHAVFMIRQNLGPRRGALRPLGVYIFVASTFGILELHHFPKTRSLDPAKMNDYSYTSGTKSTTNTFVRDNSFIIHVFVFLFLIEL
jgi:hypothetical protein